jgi:hypothetical protein
MDPLIFMRYIKFADSYRQGQQNIYFFLKDCGFKRIYRESGNRFPNQETQSMFQAFQNETKQANWTSNKMTANDYKMFLEDFFKKMDFKSVDLDTCQILKLITENLGVFGPFDELTSKRIVYFNNKIEKLKSSQPISPPTSGPLNYTSNNSNNINNTIPQNTTVPPNSGPQPNFDLPDAGKDSKKGGKNPAQAAEDARLNEIMRQQKLNSPIYITNVQPGQFYNPLTNPNYIPNGVDRSIPLPMSKKDPRYPEFKKLIDRELILANQELDYHKIDMARNHLEIAAFYLKNVID